MIRFDGKFLRQKREEKGLSLNELAVQLEVNGGQIIWEWETEKQIPRGDNMLKLCRFFGLPIETFFQIEEEG